MNIKDIFEFKVKDISGPLIYLIKNTLNGKCYVGQTKSSIYERFCLSGYSHKLRLSMETSDLYKDMRENLNHFEVEILEILQDSSFMDEREKFWISKLNSLETGYNRTIGGKSVNKEASDLAHKHGYLGAKAKNKGCFYNENEHRKVCSIGGTEVAKLRVSKVISTLKSKGLLLNKENYNTTKREIGPRMCPLWDKAKINYPELFI